MKRWFHRPLIYIIACYGLEILPCSAQTQEAQGLVPVKVEGRPYGEEIIGSYNQPRWSARGRFSADTDVYVLPPYAFYLDLDYHGTFRAWANQIICSLRNSSSASRKLLPKPRRASPSLKNSPAMVLPRYLARNA
jgi:hypothetical protein